MKVFMNLNGYTSEGEALRPQIQRLRANADNACRCFPQRQADLAAMPVLRDNLVAPV
jgi:hypothetical protein